MLEVARIIGGVPLKGEVRAAGAKNAALPLMAASLLSAETVTLRGVPDLSDVRFMAEILRRPDAPDAGLGRFGGRAEVAQDLRHEADVAQVGHAAQRDGLRGAQGG
ncbi:MAG: hypothetical protein ACKOIB_07570, partial [Verrucomicrobiota bacterium]